ncbi:MULTISPECIES: ArsR/SmtB family transcription factor [Methylobacterium]|uniref:ArsR/SmtB family transcription factor n=1 Tax=Methylobacterium TaxID=407 RepID=UPI00104BB101|nr:MULTISPECIES: helix-turn-helix transcriptional regulator [Methylobacterium]MDR7040167.1 DNA-binding transcriptional ArsR family regulator [Methylobacterium sp. BE186]
MPDEFGHPAPDEMDLGTIFAALADPLRRQVVLTLAASPDAVRHCSSFDLPVSKATRTHHFRVLREAGLIHQVDQGNSRSNRLRVAELRQRFPALVDLLLTEARSRISPSGDPGSMRLARAEGALLPDGEQRLPEPP